MKDDSKTNIQIRRDTKSLLDNIGVKGDTYDDIIRMVLHQRNILLIHQICKDEIMPKDWREYDNETAEIFRQIDFKVCDEEIKWACEMSTDEDFVGNYTDDIELPLAEVVTNAYCLLMEIDSPTFSLSRGMRNPFARF